MKSKRKTAKIIVIVIVIIGVVWLFSNHTTNVFEEMYYSAFPTVKSGKTYTDLENVEGMMVIPNHDIFLLFPDEKLYVLKHQDWTEVLVEINKNEFIQFCAWIEYKEYCLHFLYRYWPDEKKLYAEVYLVTTETGEMVEDEKLRELLPEILKENGMLVVSKEELREQVLEELVGKWLDGNRWSKFSKDDWGDVEIVYGFRNE